VPQACELAFLLKKEGMDIGDGVLDAQQCAKAIAEKIQKNG